MVDWLSDTMWEAMGTRLFHSDSIRCNLWVAGQELGLQGQHEFRLNLCLALNCAEATY